MLGDVEAVVDLWRSYRRATQGADPKLIRAVEMKAEGYTYEEIALELQRNPRMVPRYISSMRTRLRRTP